jgi:hypothetical protein
LVIVYSFNLKPVILVQTSAILDGLLLTPLQALAVGLVLYRVMPRMFSRDISTLVRPNPLLGAGLVLAFVVFGYFCIAQIPQVL